MLLGIPNLGKSALANSLHQIGRVAATEKGKLRHSIVSPQPGEIQNISSLKIGSNPSIYVLDTPAILPPQINDIEVCSKLALTGALSDSLVGEKELAQYFLSIINSSDEYKKWAKLISSRENKMSLSNCNLGSSSDSTPETQKRKQYATDHTQDFMVHNVRRALFNLISSFEGDLENEKNKARLIETELISLREALQVIEEDNDTHLKVAAKLINLFLWALHFRQDGKKKARMDPTCNICKFWPCFTKLGVEVHLDCRKTKFCFLCEEWFTGDGIKKHNNSIHKNMKTKLYCVGCESLQRSLVKLFEHEEMPCPLGDNDISLLVKISKKKNNK
ncbi:hypothetical protein ACFE04_011077 [Oxalis oulophora]